MNWNYIFSILILLVAAALYYWNRYHITPILNEASSSSQADASCLSEEDASKIASKFFPDQDQEKVKQLLSSYGFADISPEGWNFSLRPPPDAVLKVVQHQYTESDVGRVCELLRKYGGRRGEPERERVQLSILKRSDGNIEQLQSLIKQAKHDFREVISPGQITQYVLWLMKNIE